jgi:predicted outer membrane protein
MVCGSSKGEDTEKKALATEALPKLHEHTKMAFEPAGEKAEFDKLCKVQEFAKQVMAEK